MVAMVNEYLICAKYKVDYFHKALLIFLTTQQGGVMNSILKENKMMLRESKCLFGSIIKVIVSSHLVFMCHAPS